MVFRSKKSGFNYAQRLHNRLGRLLLLMLIGWVLSACDNVPLEPEPNLGASPNRILAYAGPSCGEGFSDQTMRQDACTFKVEFWNKLVSSQCANCHDSQSGSRQTPFFLDSSDVNAAYTQAVTIVDLADPASSVIIDKIALDNHNCGDPGACAAFANIVEGYITNWANGGSATSGGEANNQIVLTPPRIRNTGTSRSFPPTAITAGTNGSSFANTIWPIVNDNCSDCHTESATIPQAPFFAEDDIDAAYEALITSQKINLDDPAISRLVVRLDPELHNCWDPNNSGGADCPASATTMLNAIIQFRNGIPLSQVNPAWVTSKAIDLTDGILASGGARDDSSTIALYEMKTGSGSTLYDTSGVEPALNLSLTGTQDIDFRWVGGWGIEFMTGRAQGSAQNSKLRDQLAASGAYSIEAWIVPANVNQGTAGDPARVISYSGSDNDRNFTLGQAEYRYEFMNRTANTDANGEPSLITDADDEDLQASQQHVVATYDSVNGRKIYVNGVDVSTVGNDSGSTDDPATVGSLLDWNDSFAFILGAEAGGSKQWQGKLRLVAIHNRAMTPAQVLQNFDAGVGEKFFLMFSVSELINNPTDNGGNSDCFQTSAVTPSNPNGDQCFIYMLVSQFDSYSYLFSAPTFISLNPAFSPGDTVIRGMRIGVNGKEPVVGQAFSNVGRTTPLTINATDYDPLSGGQVLSNIGTIIALEKGAGADEFFLSFEQFGANNDGNVHANAEYVCDVLDISTCLSTPADGAPVSDIGLRTFNEINASMAAITGVDPNTASVKNTYDVIEQQMPAVETIDGFVSANQMAIAQLAIQYCDALVEDIGGVRTPFFGAGFDFTADVDTAFTAGGKDQIVEALYDKIVAYRASGSTTELSNMPSLIEFKNELINAPASGNYPGNLFDRLYTAATCPSGCDQARTRAVTKALCTSALGSAAMLLQ